MQHARTVSKVQKSRSWSVLDRARKRVRDSCIAKVRQFEDLELLFSEGVAKHFMETSQCIVIKKGVRLGLPTGVTAVEQSQAKGREEQRLRALRDFLQIMVVDARRHGVELILDHLVAQGRETCGKDPELPCEE